MSSHRHGEVASGSGSVPNRRESSGDIPVYEDDVEDDVEDIVRVTAELSHLYTKFGRINNDKTIIKNASLIINDITEKKEEYEKLFYEKKKEYINLVNELQIKNDIIKSDYEFFQQTHIEVLERIDQVFGLDNDNEPDKPDDREVSNNFKTIMCRYHSMGNCHRVNCRFAHGEEELRTSNTETGNRQDDNEPDDRDEREAPNRFKTLMCKFRHTSCIHGRNCHYAHNENELVRTVVCTNYASGRCTFGNRCRFIHDNN